MEQLNLYRTALDALYFLLKQLPEGLVSDSSRIVLEKIVSDIFNSYRNLFDTEKSE